MTKQEFLKMIEKVENMVQANPSIGLCHRFGKRFYIVRRIFQCNFSPCDGWGYWLDDRCNKDDSMNERERRLMFLECFKQWALCYKEYERF